MGLLDLLGILSDSGCSLRSARSKRTFGTRAAGLRAGEAAARPVLTDRICWPAFPAKPRLRPAGLILRKSPPSSLPICRYCRSGRNCLLLRRKNAIFAPRTTNSKRERHETTSSDLPVAPRRPPCRQPLRRRANRRAIPRANRCATRSATRSNRRTGPRTNRHTTPSRRR